MTSKDTNPIDYVERVMAIKKMNKTQAVEFIASQLEITPDAVWKWLNGTRTMTAANKLAINAILSTGEKNK